jgi:hypothetical protein
MRYKDLETGQEFENTYSQELQRQDIALKKNILIIGIAIFIIMFLLTVMFGMIVYTGVLSNALRILVCG